MKIIIAITGASGVSYAVSLLEKLHAIGSHELFLVVSEWGEKNLYHECGLLADDLLKYVKKRFCNDDLGAPISSSSFLVDQMVILPASVKTCSEIAHGHTDNLIVRAADNMLRMRKKLIVCLRETPLSTVTIENLLKISIAGGIVFPLCPPFYSLPETIADIRDIMVGKILDLLAIENDYSRWGMEEADI